MHRHQITPSHLKLHGTTAPPRCVAIAVPTEAPWNEMSAMAMDSCQKLGLEAFLVNDGDEAGFAAD
jgi:hypothetical protein